MSKQIGIRLSGLPTIAELLYFDEITLVSREYVATPAELRAELRRDAAWSRRWIEAGVFPRLGELPRTIKIDREEKECVDQLVRKGLVVPATKFLELPESREVLQTEGGKFVRRLVKALQVVKRFETSLESELGRDAALRVLKKMKRSRGAKRSARPVHDKISRWLASVELIPWRKAIEAHPGCEPTTIYDGSVMYSSGDSLSPVLEVVLRKFPTPTPDTALESVLEFRSDEDAM